jgi:predicted metal-binding membrane protein
MSEQTTTESLLRRDRMIVIAGLALITAIAWWWVLAGAGTGMSTLGMTTWRFPPPIHKTMMMGWSFGYAVIMFFMWWIMMIAMMTPSATPMILLYARVHRHAHKDKPDSSVAPTFSFALGYLIAWAAFSLVATLMQWGLEWAGLLHAMKMWSVSPLFSGSLLVVAGLYQLSPLKNVCLDHCRSPIHFLSQEFRPGPLGALRMGWKHGLFCIGCCWFLMALLFAGGIMNLVWIAGLAIFVLVEKVAPAGQWIARGAGAMMIAAGAWVLWQYGMGASA